MTTVAEIAKEAFDDVAAEMPEVIQTAVLKRTAQGDYDPATGSYKETTETFSCRALFGDEAATADTFPAYTIGPSDRIAYLEGLQTVPREGDAVVIGSQPVTITRVSDIVGVGSFFAVVVRNT